MARPSSPGQSGMPRRRPRQVRPVTTLPGLLSGGWRTWIDFAALLVLLVLCALGGGSAFADTLSLLYVRPAAVIALFLFLTSPARPDWSPVRTPILLLAVFAGVMVFQLVPLPPGVWLALPGREAYARLSVVTHSAPPWRPLSLTPDLTANSLVALIVPAAVLVGFAKLTPEQRRWLVVGLIMLCCASAALGVAQFAGGQNSPLYLYKRTYEGFTVGLLANRNHQAVFLALIFPALRLWTLRPTKGRSSSRQNLLIALMLATLTVPVILATGSRAGMVITAVSLAATVALFPLRGAADGVGSRWSRPLRWAVPAMLLALIALSYVLGRAASIERFSTVAIGEDDRLRFAPVVAKIIEATFPAGTGLGGFDIVFRQYEPDAILGPAYFNHAHNELLELAMTAGLPGLLLLLAFIAWVVSRIVKALRTPAGEDQIRAYVLVGAMAVLLLLGASLVDYPLRTPFLSAIFALSCGWLGLRTRQKASSPGQMPSE